MTLMEMLIWPRTKNNLSCSFKDCNIKAQSGVRGKYTTYSFVCGERDDPVK